MKRARAAGFYTEICAWQTDDTDNDHLVRGPAAIIYRLQEGYLWNLRPLSEPADSEDAGWASD